MSKREINPRAGNSSVDLPPVEPGGEGGESDATVEMSQETTDTIIARWIGVKTPREIAAKTGLKPEEVIRRSRAMLDEIDVLTVQQKRQQFIIDLTRMARDAEIAAKNTTDEFKAGLYNSAIAAMKEQMRQLEAMEKKDSGAVETLNQLRIRELLSLMKEVVDTSVQEIAEEYSLDEDELYDVFNRRLVAAAERRDAVATGGSQL